VGKHFKMECWKCGGTEWPSRLSPVLGCRACAPAKGTAEHQFLLEGVWRGLGNGNDKHQLLYKRAHAAFLAVQQQEAEVAAAKAARKAEREAKEAAIEARRKARTEKFAAEAAARAQREAAREAKREAKRLQEEQAAVAKAARKAEAQKTKRLWQSAVEIEHHEERAFKQLTRENPPPQDQPVTQGIPSPDEAGVKIDRLYAEMRFLEKVDAALAAFPKAPRCTCCPELKKLTETEDGKLFCPVCAYGVLRSGYCTFHSTEHYPDLAASAPRVPLYTFPRELLGNVDPERFRPGTSGTAEAVFDP